MIDQAAFWKNLRTISSRKTKEHPTNDIFKNLLLTCCTGFTNVNQGKTPNLL